MNSGALTERQKLNLEERTALFVNLAGVEIQSRLDVADVGVSTRRLYKVLANCIWDWHWLSHTERSRYAFLGIGDLVWVSNRFGSLGQIMPRLSYDNLPLEHGLFANLLSLMQTGQYAKYGLRNITSDGHTRRILFALNIPFDVIVKSCLHFQEWHHWRILATTYGGLDDADLDALASCRTPVAATHSLWIQYVMWKRFAGLLADQLSTAPLQSISEEALRRLRNDAEGASAAVHQLFVKLELFDNIDTHLERVRAIAAKTELAGKIPCIHTLAVTDIGSNLPGLRRGTAVLSALNSITREFFRLFGLEKGPAKITSIGDGFLRLKKAGVKIGREESSEAAERLFYSKEQREIGQFLGRLIGLGFAEIGQFIDLKIERPTGHYQKLIDTLYPLPRDQFTIGN